MRVHVNSVEHEVVDEGDGVPVVFSPGGSSEASHFVSYQQPERFNDLVLDFIARH